MQKHVCVFCGAHPGQEAAFSDAAAALGRCLVRRGLGIVTGGGHVGLMGVIADAALAEGGRVVGVIPQALADREVAHEGLSELHVVNSMHERKALMANLSDAFIALPGGYGTLDEFFEIVTWAQLGIHTKPIGLLNVQGYYNDLLSMLRTAVKNGYVSEANRGLIRDAVEIEQLLHELQL